MMRAILQRVHSAQVQVDQETVGAIQEGLVAFIAINQTDTWNEAQRIADKIVNLRIFRSTNERFDRSLLQTGGGLLIISQFTLYGETRKGRRPSWFKAAAPNQAEPLFDELVTHLKTYPIPIETGIFGADMRVSLTNDGPVTLILDTDEWVQGRG